MEKYYVQRNANGVVNGVFSHPYPEAKELLPENHPDIVAFRNKPRTPAPSNIKPVGPTEV